MIQSVSLSEPPSTRSGHLGLPSRIARNGWIVLALLALFAFQLYGADSDLSPVKRIGDYTDEGYYLHNAKSKILFGEFLKDELMTSFIGAPLHGLLVYASYKTFGVSLLSARLVSVVALWGVLLMIFFIMKREVSLSIAFLSVFALGFMHELLMYARWATPVIVEVMNMVAVIFFWEMGKRRHVIFFLLAGAALPLAIFSKLTAIYFCLPVGIFAATEVFVTKRVPLKHALFALVAAITVGGVAAATFVRLQWSNYVFFMDSVGKFSNHASIRNMKETLFALVHFTTAKNPSVVWLFFVGILGLTVAVSRIVKDRKLSLVKEIPSPAWFFICWIVVYPFPMIMNGEYGYDRRMVHFLVPLTVLAVYLFHHVFRPPEMRVPEARTVAPGVFVRIILPTLLAGFFVYYARAALGSFFLWMAQVHPEDLGIIKVGALIPWCAAAGALPFLFFSFGRRRLVIGTLFVTFFATSLALNATWYLGATYTLRDTSRAIEKIASKAEVFAGTDAHSLSCENRTFPMLYMRPDYGKQINAGFINSFAKDKLLLTQLEMSEGVPFIPNGEGFIDTSFMKPNQPKRKIMDLQLFPFPFSTSYRTKLTLYEIN